MIELNKNVEKLQALKCIVGDEVFSTIQEHFNGEHIYFNRRTLHPDKKERDAAIRKDYYRGIPPTELVKKYGMKLTSIYKITESKL